MYCHHGCHFIGLKAWSQLPWWQGYFWRIISHQLLSQTKPHLTNNGQVLLTHPHNVKIYLNRRHGDVWHRKPYPWSPRDRNVHIRHSCLSSQELKPHPTLPDQTSHTVCFQFIPTSPGDFHHYTASAHVERLSSAPDLTPLFIHPAHGGCPPIFRTFCFIWYLKQCT